MAFEVNGSGVLNSILNLECKADQPGEVNNYVIQLGISKKLGGEPAIRHRVAGAVYRCAIRQRADPAARRTGVKTPGGTFSGFTNTDDAAPGGGSSVNVQQRIEGASGRRPCRNGRKCGRCGLTWMWK